MVLKHIFDSNFKSQYIQYKGFLNTSDLLIKPISSSISGFEMDVNELSDIPLTEIPGNIVLGKRIEYLFHSYIEQSTRYELIEKNIQVIRNKITIGELDFILKDNEKNKVLHVELVYKFYLFVGGKEELSSWIGPNNNDSLVNKLDKLEAKQFPLLKNDRTIEILRNLDLNVDEIEQQVCFLGNLFLPYHLKKLSINSVNKSCVVGWWLNLKDFMSSDLDSSKFKFPKKQDWIVTPDDNIVNWLSFDEFVIQLDVFHKKKKSPLCWLYLGDGVYERFFIVWWS
tara:strand:+ start:564 stop:1412 length:849 start_codon:yes stop_codon:yes gene_type:complete